MYSHPRQHKADSARLVPALLQRRSPETRTEDRENVQKILLPVDADGTFRAALDHVLTLSRTLPVRVHLVNVQPSLHARDCTRAMRARWSDAHYRALAELQWARRKLEAEDIECEIEIVFGNPAREIVRCAVGQGCDKIVMTRRAQSYWRSLFAPSLAKQVVKASPLPVTVVQALPDGRTDEPFRPSGLKDLVQTQMQA